MKSFVWFTTVLFLCIELARAAHLNPIHRHRQHQRTPTNSTLRSLRRRANRRCNPSTTNGTPNPTIAKVDVTNGPRFPSLDFNMPSNVPSSIDNWWSNPKTEYAFFGFSYSVASCQSAETLRNEFKDMRDRFNSRYVRLYGGCDRDGFYNDVVNAAWDARIGVYALIWFGWEDPNIWKSRRDKLLYTLHNNPKAKFVTRAVQFGSEPLYDNALSAYTLAAEVGSAKANLAPLGIPVCVSEMAYAFQNKDTDGAVMNAEDLVCGNVLPFFSHHATTAQNSRSLIQSDLDFFINSGHGKKIVFTQTGWPSGQSGSTMATSYAAASGVEQERDYFILLDSMCPEFKTVAGGVGWFAHLYSVHQDSDYGVLGYDGIPKFTPFSHRSSC